MEFAELNSLSTGNGNAILSHVCTNKCLLTAPNRPKGYVDSSSVPLTSHQELERREPHGGGVGIEAVSLTSGCHRSFPRAHWVLWQILRCTEPLTHSLPCCWPRRAYEHLPHFPHTPGSSALLDMNTHPCGKG